MTLRKPFHEEKTAETEGQIHNQQIGLHLCMPSVRVRLGWLDGWLDGRVDAGVHAFR